ncbi:tRNA lysidine(34) synthetase TilS [Stenotrophomonas sp. YIM B06876]|uniref:tRNA lysidine(34) synthetase TilS n=1 Tax=Stenotrophomonas sp. YIM B06876 TaxID=3060211 RepID=UPI002739B8B0|nr:tRNA lysidine(34) synthetase TilS [Stenotrophomonas sp. YIM B06876]
MPIPLPAFPAAPAPVLVGFSGGLDSTVLLHLLASDPRQRHRGLRALHVHHGLQVEADAWTLHCQQVCEQLQVPLQVERAEVARGAGSGGVEAAAREARHAAFAAVLQPGDWLALAHHLDDQAETFLLRALRGSGVEGLAAMQPLRPFGNGQLWRPLLHTPGAALLEYARHHRLQWIEDPSNACVDYDRNFLRLQVMPLLARRWPHVAGAFARSAALAGEAASLLAGQDQHDLQGARSHDGSLSVPALNALPAPRRARVLRRWIGQLGFPPLPAHGVRAIERQLLKARADLQPCFAWHGVQVKRWRDQLHGMVPVPAWPPDWQAVWDGRAPLPLPDGGQLQLLGAAAFAAAVSVRGRNGGERMQLPGRTHSHSLKQLLQESELPPWRRARLPLLYAGDELLAAGDSFVSATLQHWLDGKGARLLWRSGDDAN